jgi:Family of unknown function (DUF6356)
MMRRNKDICMFRQLFLSHPQQAGESYLQHQRVALSFALPLLGAGLVAIVHALIPGLFQRTAGDIIRKLHGRLEER